MATDGDPSRTYHAVLIYDGECPFCSTAAVAVRRIDGVGATSWYDDAAQSLLETQFEEVPFALVLVDVREEAVYVGAAAARELADRAGLPGLVGSLVGDHYEPMAEAVQRTVGSGTSPDHIETVEPLTATARARFDALERSAVQQVEYAPDAG